jgi:hypothetical protein
VNFWFPFEKVRLRGKENSESQGFANKRERHVRLFIKIDSKTTMMILLCVPSWLDFNFLGASTMNEDASLPLNGRVIRESSCRTPPTLAKEQHGWVWCMYRESWEMLWCNDAPESCDRLERSRWRAWIIHDEPNL